ncbi:hypothetical protein DAEQUDRAFT_82878 [Daedalea quercina L-15889]|uniref:Uncharacterized protein n=1 Tax=Daedalea quercina L-15889 TaxID=1314783 RepID=A0A165SHR1_9APHY|nr:hypothetical protein DAEQUDRAFT_82878 [Daedalea quercina L-15889]
MCRAATATGQALPAATCTRSPAISLSEGSMCLQCPHTYSLASELATFMSSSVLHLCYAAYPRGGKGRRTANFKCIPEQRCCDLKFASQFGQIKGVLGYSPHVTATLRRTS